MKNKINKLILGEILMEDYMKPMGLSQNALARAIKVPPRRINEIVHGKRAVTLDTSLRLGVYFKQSPKFWLNIQNECDFRDYRPAFEKIVKKISPFRLAPLTEDFSPQKN